MEVYTLNKMKILAAPTLLILLLCAATMCTGISVAQSNETAAVQPAPFELGKLIAFGIVNSGAFDKFELYEMSPAQVAYLATSSLASLKYNLSDAETANVISDTQNAMRAWQMVGAHKAIRLGASNLDKSLIAFTMQWDQVSEAWEAAHPGQPFPIDRANWKTDVIYNGLPHLVPALNVPNAIAETSGGIALN